MLVFLPAESGGRGESRLVRHVRFERAEGVVSDAHRSADAGHGTVFVDAVNSEGALEVPAGARARRRGAVDAREGLQAVLRGARPGAPLGAGGGLMSRSDALGAYAPTDWDAEGGGVAGVVATLLRALGYGNAFCSPPPARLCCEPIVLTAAVEPEAGRELVSSGRLCANARYNSVGYQPWYDHRHDVEAVEIAADMATYDHVNTNYWFYGHQEIASVTGMGNLSGVREMQHTFNSCVGLTEIDLSGLDPSSLEDLAYTFGGRGSLVTIWADADWALPSSGASGFQTFYQCSSLVGGAGTTYASSRAGYQYMRIDGVRGAGYLTAKSS